MIITCVMPVFTQNNSITGTISSNSESVPFVNIYISKTKIGTTSDENGFYELKNIPNGKHTLVLSCIGYQTKIIKITVEKNQKTQRDFSLIEDNSLDEI
ncbi:MAG: carboxypeptidase-like regulatory domain-containing protein, partial [Polaribacter sp.]|nr:carboxypeptidase-like regulatory domain-containing protein [Polaribacter sp.]